MTTSPRHLGSGVMKVRRVQSSAIHCSSRGSTWPPAWGRDTSNRLWLWLRVSAKGQCDFCSQPCWLAFGVAEIVLTVYVPCGGLTQPQGWWPSRLMSLP